VKSPALPIVQALQSVKVRGQLLAVTPSLKRGRSAQSGLRLNMKELLHALAPSFTADV
jgi:hypothetical protein